MKTGPGTPGMDDSVPRLLVLNNPAGPAAEPHLRAALDEALASLGGMMRAGLIMEAAVCHALDRAVAAQLACAVEYWHQASLILDDLPCMDDAAHRRGRPSLHRTHGEATAILAALALINRAYALVQHAFIADSIEVRQGAINLIEPALGPAGILSGQAWDLHYGGGAPSAREVGRIAWHKTGALMRLTVSLPLLPSGAWQQEHRSLRAICLYWALAYQALDDLRDVATTSNASGKTAGRDVALHRPNLTIALGMDMAERRIGRLLRLAASKIEALIRRDKKWIYLLNCHERLFVARFRLLVAA